MVSSPRWGIRRAICHEDYKEPIGTTFCKIEGRYILSNIITRILYIRNMYNVHIPNTLQPNT